MIDCGRRLRRDGDGSRGCRNGNRCGSDSGLLNRCLDRLRRLLDRCLNRLSGRRLLGLCLSLLSLSSGVCSGSATLATSGRSRSRRWLGSRLLLDLLGFIFHLRSLNSSRLWCVLLHGLLCNMLLILLHGLLLLLSLLLRDMLLVLLLLLHVLLIVLSWVLCVLSGVLSMGCVLMLRVLLLLGRVLRDGHG